MYPAIIRAHASSIFRVHYEFCFIAILTALKDNSVARVYSSREFTVSIVQSHLIGLGNSFFRLQLLSGEKGFGSSSGYGFAIRIAVDQ